MTGSQSHTDVYADLVVPPRPPLPGTAPASAGSLRRRLVRDPRAWLIAYGLVLAGVAFWPTPVDADAGPLIAAITRIFPVLTHARLEFVANIALFVPLGVLLAMILHSTRHLVLPIAFLTTVAVECVQAVALDLRTPSTLDIIANTAGACLGLLAAVFIERLRASRSEPNGPSPHS